MQFLLRLKPWQLFLILILPLAGTQLPLVGRFFHYIWAIFYFGWVYAIGTHMRKLIPVHLRPSSTYFKFSIYSVFFLATTIDVLYYVFDPDAQMYDYEWIFWIILFYTVWNVLYAYSFAGRMLESARNGEAMGFGASYKAFLAIWFYPIGIWFIQPWVLQANAEIQLPPSQPTP